MNEHVHCYNCGKVISKFKIVDSVEEVRNIISVGVLHPVQAPEGVGFAIKNVPICPTCYTTIELEQKAQSKLITPRNNSARKL